MKLLCFCASLSETWLIIRDTDDFDKPRVSPVTWRNLPEAKRPYPTRTCTVVDKAWFRDVSLSRSSRRSSDKNSMDSRPKIYRLLNSSSVKLDREMSSGCLNILSNRGLNFNLGWGRFNRGLALIGFRTTGACVTSLADLELPCACDNLHHLSSGDLITEFFFISYHPKRPSSSNNLIPLQAFVIYLLIFLNKYKPIGRLTRSVVHVILLSKHLWTYFEVLKNVTGVLSNASLRKSLDIFAYEIIPIDISMAWPYTKLPESISNIKLEISMLIRIDCVDQQ